MTTAQARWLVAALASGAFGALLIHWLTDPEARNVLVAAATVVIALAAVLGLLLRG